MLIWEGKKRHWKNWLVMATCQLKLKWWKGGEGHASQESEFTDERFCMEFS